MPKVVDHEERRSQIAEAVWRIATTRGLQGVTFREVAAEAQVSVSLVQHYFGTKAGLVIWSLNQNTARMSARIARRLRTALVLEHNTRGRSSASSSRRSCLGRGEQDAHARVPHLRGGGPDRAPRCAPGKRSPTRPCSPRLPHSSRQPTRTGRSELSIQIATLQPCSHSSSVSRSRCSSGEAQRRRHRSSSSCTSIASSPHEPAQTSHEGAPNAPLARGPGEIGVDPLRWTHAPEHRAC